MRPQHLKTWIATAVLALPCIASWSQTSTAVPPTPIEADRSGLDGALLFQLLVAEMEMRSGDFNAGYAKILDAARRTRSDELYERATVLAANRGTAEQALGVVRSWRQTMPESREAIQYELQLLVQRGAAGRTADLAEPLAALITRTPASERPGVIAGTASLIRRLPAEAATAQMVDTALRPHTAAPTTRTAALVATARGWLHAGQAAKALPLLQAASQHEASAVGPALVALDMLGQPAAVAAPAESVVQTYLSQPQAVAAVRLAYAQALTQSNRYVDALAQLRIATDAQPSEPRAWLTRGALEVELRQPRDADRSLAQFLSLQGPATADGEDGAAEVQVNRAAQQEQALLLLAQAAQLRGDAPAAHRWLDQLPPASKGNLEPALRRALLWASEGKDSRLREARALIAALPENEEITAKTKTLAESQVLREAKRWADAQAVLVAASAAAPDDTDLLYERAMVAEKLGHHGEMEQLLRRVMQLKPKHPHAHNALGYALADRGLRLPEARTLIETALSLAPNDPFIADSMGWVEFRLGNLEAALRHLQGAYAKRPDTEIAAHLGEVLWASGQRDEARRIWKEGRDRDANNEVLRETLKRLQVRL